MDIPDWFSTYGLESRPRYKLERYLLRLAGLFPSPTLKAGVLQGFAGISRSRLSLGALPASSGF